MKRIFLLLLSVVTLDTVCAQVGEYRDEYAIGGGGGYVLSRISFMPEVQQQMHGGLIGGLTFRYTCEKYFSCVCALTGEVNFAQLGWKEKILDSDDNPVINTLTELPEEYERTINYVQVPVFARLGWGRERKGFQFFFQAGPQLGIYLNEQTKTNFDLRYRNASKRVSQVVAQDTMSVQRNLDYGIAAGLGLEYSHPKVGHFMLEGRYYYGLGDIYRNSKRDYFGRSAISNIVIKLTYLFDFKKTNNPKIK